LVVIAIIAVLIALLLPAINKVRDSAVRVQCANNLKQIGIALANYHDPNGSLPPGCTTDQPPFGGNGGWGSSWMVYLLPFVEQQGMFSSWQFSLPPGTTGNTNSGYVNPVNMALATGGTYTAGTPPSQGTYAQGGGVVIKTYRCPASPLPMFVQNGNRKVMQSNYVGISGAANGTIPGYTESRIDNSGAGLNCCSGGGPASGGGVLFRGSQVKFSDMAADGSSNVMFVSEHGDWMICTDGSKRQWTAAGLYGWTMGSNSNSTPNSPTATGNDNRQFNCTTIRYAINQKTGWSTNGGTGTQSGDCTVGVCYDVGNNIPLNSTHPGGINAVFGDASVRFLSNETALDILARVAVRDDGQAVPPLP